MKTLKVPKMPPVGKFVPIPTHTVKLPKEPRRKLNPDRPQTTSKGTGQK